MEARATTRNDKQNQGPRRRAKAVNQQAWSRR